MTMSEYDPEITRWGLHHLICKKNSSSDHFDDFYGDIKVTTEIQNDEAAMSALQEEFSQISSAKASNLHQLSDFDNYWQKRMDYILGADGHKDGEVVASDSLSIPEDFLDLNEWSMLGEYLHNEEEIGKRLNKVSPTPHVPRINNELPFPNESASDHQRLFERLELYDLVEKKVDGDGNCQFRALSDQLYRTPENHKFLRKQVVDQLKSHQESYEGYVPMTYDEYLKKMSRNGEWGDHVTLQAAADLYGVKIFIFTSFKDTCCIEILPTAQKSKKVLLLSFWAEVHYNSIYADGGAELVELKKKKKWRLFGH